MESRSLRPPAQPSPEEAHARASPWKRLATLQRLPTQLLRSPQSPWCPTGRGKRSHTFSRFFRHLFISSVTPGIV